MLRLNHQRGQSILEVIVAMAIFALIGAAMVAMVVGSFIALTQGGEQTQAEALAQEGIEAVRSIRDGAWNEIIYSQSAVTTSSSQWIFSGEGTDETIGQYSRTITFSNVCRDGSNDITTCPGSYTDVHSKQAAVSVSWETREGITNTVQRIAYLTNWDSREWTQTDWSGGSGQTTWSDATKYDSDDGNIDNSTAGEVKLAEAAGGSWVLSGGTEITHTSDTDFSGGTFNNTEVSGTGNDAKIVLTQSTGWVEHADSQIVTTEDLNDLDAVSASDIWAVAKKGETYHYNGTNWSAGTDVGNFDLQAIDMFSSSDGWTVDDKGKIYHYDGTSWSEDTDTGNEEWYAVETISASNVWVVGKDGKAAHYNGSSWTESTPSSKDLNGVDSIASNDIWAVGNDGTIIHYNGTSWSSASSPTSNKLQDVSVVSATDVWAVGESGTIIHYNGTSWSSVSLPTGNRLRSISMVLASDGWAVGDSGTIIYYNGTSWSIASSPVGSQLNGISMVSNSDGWIVGVSGIILQYTTSYQSSGTFLSSIIDSGDTSTNWSVVSWTETLPSGADITISTRTGNTATPDGSWDSWSSELTSNLGDTITSADGQYLQYRVTFTRGSDTTQTPEFEDITMTYNAPTTENLNALSIISASDIWAAGRSGKILRYNGTSWSEHTDTGNEEWYDIAMISSSNGWVVGKNGALARYNDATWTESTIPDSADVNCVYALSASNIWAAGKSGRIWHYDGASWSLYTDTGNETWNDIFMISASEGWVVGNNGVLAQYDGTNWTESTMPSSANINGVYALSNSNIWAVGESGRFWHYDGTSWSLHTDTGSERWEAVYLNNASDGWAVGNGGNIRHWLGISWDSFTSPTNNDLNDVEMVSILDGWAVGDNGTILHFSRDNLYVTSGYLISSAFDTGSSSSIQIIEWDQTTPSCSPACEVKFQIQTATDDSGSPGTWSTTWCGPDGEDGDETDYFAISTGQLIHTDHNGDQWIRYKATLSGDSTDTPVLEEIRINYK